MFFSINKIANSINLFCDVVDLRKILSILILKKLFLQKQLLRELLIKFNKIKINKYKTIKPDYADLMIYPNIYIRLIPDQ